MHLRHLLAAGVNSAVLHIVGECQLTGVIFLMILQLAHEKEVVAAGT